MVLLAGAVLGLLCVLLAFAVRRFTRHLLVVSLLIAALVYVFFSADAHAGAGWLFVELLGVLLYGALAFRGLRGSVAWLAVGWALHPVWDLGLHYFGPGRAFAPDWYTVSCFSFDIVVAAVIALGAGLSASRMGPALKAHFDGELATAAEAEAAGDFPRAWRSLERAHVLSQAHAGPHLRVHGAMAAFAWRRGNVQEVLGQLPRLLLAAPGSWLGRAPLGNTGGANVGIFTPMEIPEDLRRLLGASQVEG